MIETDPALYEVVGRQNNHLWLEVLESEDRGLQVSVPHVSRDYTDEIQEKVNNLEVGDKREFVLSSETDYPPQWKIKEVGEYSESREMIA